MRTIYTKIATSVTIAFDVFRCKWFDVLNRPLPRSIINSEEVQLSDKLTYVCSH